MAEAAVSAAGEGVVNKQNMPFELDAGVAHRAAIGLVVLATDNTIEHEFRQMPRIDGVAFYESRISAQSVSDAALELGREPDVDAVFVAGTSIRLAEGVEALEAELGKPVTSSNHALAWHCPRLAGYHEPVPGLGRLLRV